MTDLSTQKCIPCTGDVPALEPHVQEELLQEVGGAWQIIDQHHLSAHYTFPNFVKALAFTNAIGAVAEEEGHHPDILLSWGRVGVSIWTHKIDGLTKSDFILAAKIDKLVSEK